jgi:hypothetical protein
MGELLSLRSHYTASDTIKRTHTTQFKRLGPFDGLAVQDLSERWSPVDVSSPKPLFTRTIDVTTVEIDLWELIVRHRRSAIRAWQLVLSQPPTSAKTLAEQREVKEEVHLGRTAPLLLACVHNLLSKVRSWHFNALVLWCA